MQRFGSPKDLFCVNFALQTKLAEGMNGATFIINMLFPLVTIHPPTAVILEKATTVSPHAIIGGLPGPDNHIADCTCPAKMAGDDYNRIDAELHQIKAR